MIYFSDFEPLFFDVLANDPAARETAFVQELYCSLPSGGTPVYDVLPLQVLVDEEGDTADFFLLDEEGNELRQFYPSKIEIDDPKYAYMLLDDGIHPLWTADDIGRVLSVAVDYGGKRYVSRPFFLTDCESVAEETTLLRYSNSSNVTPYNTAFVIGGFTQLFKWRLICGCKPAGFSPLLDSEEFRNQRQEEEILYAAAYGKYVLTVGDAQGVPYYYADLLNRILTCDSVELYDRQAGVWREIRRSGNAVPQLTETFQGSGLFFVTQEIEYVLPIINL